MRRLRAWVDRHVGAAALAGLAVAIPLGLAWIGWSLLDATGETVAWDRIAAGCAAIVAVALGAAWLAGRAWRPVLRSLAARSVDDLAPLPLDGPDEAKALAAAVNRVLAHQQAQTERQKRMVADASHQLRTPLAAIRTLLQSTPPALIGQRVPELLHTVDRATQVANEFLTQMKLEQRLAQPRAAEAQRLDEVAREAALEFSPLIADKRLAFSLDALPLRLRADAWMLGELVRNLLANAIGHSPGGAPLGIVVRTAVGTPELVVWDSGPGISDEARERAFEPFAAATRSTGVGLGLSICRQLAQAMGAQVQLFNRSDGERVVGVDAVVRWDAPQVS